MNPQAKYAPSNLLQSLPLRYLTSRKIRLARAFFPLLGLLSFAMAQTTSQVTIWKDMYYEGDSVQVPADNHCHALSEFQPDLASQVSSIQIPDGVQCFLTEWQCLSMTEDASTKTIGPPGMSSLYNVDFNDKLVNIACLTPAQNSY
ncbi:uncharacterized protein BO87DRAFT_461684 [Aspergillus neoniger CBS 115656]|uniref:Beta/gamma crystallin 'Greek key' domain-containing protein n=1 Tax=Aspergillus neoniger (strain CBS 115656) TaxID=1448310 RepID=A0A318YAL2_ASPNB|nr:hypothetical protein BO87DRAFT_461684 [Aspergillus neoniger CBS 115656]PYH31069.1 hypothetical protein BO87DRAFT_461684 [Aspergillus neoniger CBS 115656]